MQSHSLDERIKAYPWLVDKKYEIIVENGVKTAEIADALGISPEQIQRVEATETSLLSIDKDVLHQALGINLQELEGGPQQGKAIS